MDIEKVPSDVWNDLILNKIDFPFQALPIKILLSRLRISVKFDKRDEVLKQCVDELKYLFVRNQNMLSIQKDLKTILDGRRI